MNRYEVNFTISRDVEAEEIEDAEEIARDEILEGNGYYVHDYMNVGEIILLDENIEDE